MIHYADFEQGAPPTEDPFALGFEIISAAPNFTLRPVDELKTCRSVLATLKAVPALLQPPPADFARWVAHRKRWAALAAAGTRFLFGHSPDTQPEQPCNQLLLLRASGGTVTAAAHGCFRQVTSLQEALDEVAGWFADQSLSSHQWLRVLLTDLCHHPIHLQLVGRDYQGPAANFNLLTPLGEFFPATL